MTHASLFSGIGGPEIAAAMLGWENIFHCEINEFGRKILEYWFPKSKSYEDITKTSFKEWRGKVDVLTGGFPCQPFSYAGQRRGANDDRYLWPEMLRCIEECRPTWIVGENVAGITTMVEQGEILEMGSQDSLFGEGDGLHYYRQKQIFTIERVCRDLEGAGYSVQPVVVPACAVGAPHRRDRIFIIAHNTDIGHDGGESGTICREEKEERIPKRNYNRESRYAGEVRQEDSGFVEDSDKLRCRLGEIQESQHIIADTTGAGLQYGHQPRGENSQIGEIQGERGGAFKHIYVEADGNRRLIADTEEQQSERMRYEQSENCGEKQEQLGGSGGKDGGVRYVTNTCLEGLEGQDKSGCSERGERMCLRRDSSRCCEPFVTDSDCNGYPTQEEGGRAEGERRRDNVEQSEWGEQTERTDGLFGLPRYATDSDNGSTQECRNLGGYLGEENCRRKAGGYYDGCLQELQAGREVGCGERWEGFPTVSPVHRGNDGLPFDVDSLSIPFSKWRKESLKAYGNAIVPQVMYEIFLMIDRIERRQNDQ